MLFKQKERKLFKSTVLTGVLGLLTSCRSSSALESFVSPDPQLVNDSTVKQEQTQAKPSAKISNTEKVSLSDNSPIETENENENENKQALLDGQENSLLPASFPPSFPLYPEAELTQARSGENETSGMLTWDSSDNKKAIADYYEAELTANGWTIVKPFNLNSEQQFARAIALKEETRADLTLLSRSEQDSQNNRTQLSLIYQPIEEEMARSSISEAIDSAPQPNKVKPEPKPEIADSQQQNSKPQPSKNLTGVKSNNPQNFNSSGVEFEDLDRVPEQLRDSLEIVAALDILTPYTGHNNVELSKFAPNEVITRGEYARWLIEANNRYFEDDSGKKIYLAAQTSEPAFKDVKPSNPDFQAIQSLAEAGLIPSRLTDESTHLMFKPNAPLKREDLITWKVPLDMRESLPKATIEAIEESWGFQDAANIESSATRALYADYQNGERSNVRRIFGYTTLFQPKKPVTRAEAAASLWYFGLQGDGVTAKEILETESQ